MADNGTSNTDATKFKKSPGAMRKFAILIFTLVLIALLSLAGMGVYQLWMTNHESAAVTTNLKKSLDQMQTDVSTTQKALTDLQQQNQQLTTDLKTQTDALADLRKQQSTGKDDFILAEASYLVRTANENLQFEHNIPLAIKLLNSADQEIANLPDPKLYSVREAISADVAALQNAPQVDVSGIYLKLAALNDQVDKLPVVSQFQPAQTVDEASHQESLPWWRRGLQNTWQTLQHIVIVRRNQTNALPFLMPDQQVFFIQNLHAKINQAQWAVLHHQEDIYRASLQQLNDWIKQYGTQNPAVAQQLLTAVAELQGKNVQLDPLNVENTLQAFQAYIKGK